MTKNNEETFKSSQIKYIIQIKKTQKQTLLK